MAEPKRKRTLPKNTSYGGSTGLNARQARRRGQGGANTLSSGAKPIPVKGTVSKTLKAPKTRPSNVFPGIKYPGVNEVMKPRKKGPLPSRWTS